MLRETLASRPGCALCWAGMPAVQTRGCFSPTRLAPWGRGTLGLFRPPSACLLPSLHGLGTELEDKAGTGCGGGKGRWSPVLTEHLLDRNRQQTLVTEIVNDPAAGPVGETEPVQLLQSPFGTFCLHSPCPVTTPPSTSLLSARCPSVHTHSCSHVHPLTTLTLFKSQVHCLLNREGGNSVQNTTE